MNFFRGLVTGVLTALMITLFANLIAFVTRLNSSRIWLILFLPLGALLIKRIYRNLGSDYKEIATNAIDEIYTVEDLADLNDDRKITQKMGSVPFFTCILPHLLGASVGKEGIYVNQRLWPTLPNLFAVSARTSPVLLFLSASPLFFCVTAQPCHKYQTIM